MKKIFYLISSALLIASCDLTLLPEDELAPEQYFASESDCQLWSNQFYNNCLDSPSVNAGDGDDKIDNGMSAYITGGRSASTESWSFVALRNINYMLEHLNQCPDADAAKKYEGVGRFFRALWYFNKVVLYGDMPYYDYVVGSTDPGLQKPRDDRGYVMDKVLEDFEFAAKVLPSTWSAYNTRVTKWAALAYATRAALFEGTFRKYHGLEDADKYLTKAAQYGKEFITDSPFSIYKNGARPYQDLFLSENAITQEVVLARRYDSGKGVTHSIANDLNFSRISFTRRFMNHYLMADGSRFTDKAGWETMSFVQETAGRDPRMAQTVLTPGYIQPGSTKATVNTLYSHTGYQPVKYLTSAVTAVTGGGTFDWILMRAAEVYLNYAEAVAELGTITQNDLDLTVNKIRERVGLPKLDLAAANANPDKYLEKCYPNITKGTNQGVLLEIRRERTVELVLENQRTRDLLRWAEFKQALNYYVPYHGCYFPGAGSYDMDGDGVADVELYTSSASSSCPVKLKIGLSGDDGDVVLSQGLKGYIVAYSNVTYGKDWDDDRDYLNPIPAKQRELNHNLEQNPGWQDGLDF